MDPRWQTHVGVIIGDGGRKQIAGRPLESGPKAVGNGNARGTSGEGRIGGENWNEQKRGYGSTDGVCALLLCVLMLLAWLNAVVGRESFSRVIVLDVFCVLPC